MKVLVTGATGFVGSTLLKHLKAKGHETAVVSRGSGGAYNWSEESLKSGIAWADAVIHLAGENLFSKRWTKAQKEVLQQSRIAPTTRLAELVAARKPHCFISTSAVGFYPVADEEVFDEGSRNGTGFLADLCRNWEGATAPARAAGVRTAIVRVGVVLGMGGGALDKMLLPFKLFVGGPLGSGKQWVPWVHIDDLCGLFLRILENPKASGVFNATAPNPERMTAFARTLGRVLGRPSFMPAPAFAIRLALGEVADVLLTGQQVNPARAEEIGFDFRYPSLEPALRQLLTPEKG